MKTLGIMTQNGIYTILDFCCLTSVCTQLRWMIERKQIVQEGKGKNPHYHILELSISPQPP